MSGEARRAVRLAAARPWPRRVRPAPADPVAGVLALLNRAVLDAPIVSRRPAQMGCIARDGLARATPA